MISEALWPDANNSAFYVYNGGISFAPFGPLVRPPNQLWKFTPSADTGAWEHVVPLAGSNFSDLVRTTHAYYASGNGLCFALGGDRNPFTDDSIGSLEFVPTPGLVMFNSTSSHWYNLSSGFSPSGVAISGAAHFVPDFGPEGLLFAIGGYISAAGDLTPMDSVSIFDPVSRRWTTQATRGQKPVPLQNPCLVGLKGDNGTYEVGVPL